MNIIQSLLKAKRASLMMTQAETAKMLGMSITTYNGLETGKSEHSVQRKTIRKVASHLGLDEDVVWRSMNDRD